MLQEKAILAGGCFWGVQELIRALPGVISTRAGYTGGQVQQATYRNHEGHAEAVEVIFNPEKISYPSLLLYFFQIHDPTTLNRQGNDRGTSYRSEIFYTNESQLKTAKEIIEKLQATGKWPGPFATQISPEVEFWQAEEEHQDYLQKNPNGYTCHFERPGWKL